MEGHEREPTVAIGDHSRLARLREPGEICRDIQERAHQLRLRFESTHVAVLEALALNDYVTLRDMIEAERVIIEEQALLVKEHTEQILRSRRMQTRR